MSKNTKSSKNVKKKPNTDGKKVQSDYQKAKGSGQDMSPFVKPGPKPTGK
jgi:hypothetical protein